ncbi:MAG TPA: hypothetical protein VHD32_09180 [Candidatus Didemnitutus sp.]|nr:hypothetical protein [Candidatus Didemnitutus sp.]
MRIPVFIAVILLGLAGCQTVDITSEVTRDVRSYHHVFVRTASNDSAHVDQAIVQELQRLGYDASYGPRTMAPDNTEIYLEYTAQWDWDFRTYLIRLNVIVRDARSDVKLASAGIFHPGYTNKSPDQLVRLILKPVFGPKK